MIENEKEGDVETREERGREVRRTRLIGPLVPFRVTGYILWLLLLLLLLVAAALEHLFEELELGCC